MILYSILIRNVSDYTQDIVIVVVAAVGGILAVVGLVFLVCWCRKRNRKERDPESDGENGKSQRKVAKIGENSQKGSTERSGGVSEDGGTSHSLRTSQTSKNNRFYVCVYMIFFISSCCLHYSNRCTEARL